MPKPLPVRLLTHVLAIACIATAPAWTQSTSTGTVSGQVADQQGAAVAGAEVKLIDVATGTPRTTATNDTGRYSFINVDPGQYNVEISKTGFALSKLANQKVDVGQVLTLNAVLQLGSTTTTVEVQAQAGAELQTASATVGTTINGPSIMELPESGAGCKRLRHPAAGSIANGQRGGSSVGPEHISTRWRQ